MIEVRDIFKSFGTLRVLNGASLRVEAGESVAIIGRSGCGKSVLLKQIIGLQPPDRGEILIDGANIVGMNERRLLQVRRKFGMLFQSSALFDSMSVAENVGFALRRDRQMTEGQIARKVAETLELVDLPGTESRKPAELSGGMRKRVGLARALACQPQIVLYDEPTTGLDPVMADSIDQLILRVCERLKVTSVVVTHDMRSARRVGRRILMLHQGRVYAEGSPEAMFASADPVVRQFVEGVADPKAVELADWP